MNPLVPLARLLPPTMRACLVPQPSAGQMLRLAELLGVSVRELVNFRLGPRYHYRPFTVEKTDGTPRQIHAPSPALKRLQRRLLDHYLASLPVSWCATGFCVGQSIVQNARRHAWQKLIATADLRDFFTNTRAGRVRAYFARQGWSGEALHTLMRLCVFQNGLPQGAPTSPCLSNLVNIGLDDRLAKLALRFAANYTRYGDDLTFSWNADQVPPGFLRSVENVLHTAGYEIQPHKGWQVAPISQRPRVTGIVLAGHGRVRAPWAWRWRMWLARIQGWYHSEPAAIARWQGYRAMLRGVDP